MDVTKLINHKSVETCLLGASIFSAGVAAGVLLERFLSKPKTTNDIPVEENPHPQLFDPDNPPKQDRVVITLDEALAMRAADKEEPRLEEFLSPGEDEAINWIDDPESDIPLPEQHAAYIPEALAEKNAGRTSTSSEPIPFNVLESAEADVEGDWDWDVEVRRREANPEGPYQIHEEEFASGVGFHMEILYFYGVDQIVCSQNDPGDLMYDHATKLGDFKFGYGSADEDTAYVRNLSERKDYQIIQLHDSYTESVMGIRAEDDLERDELAHMDRPLRMRRLD